MTGEFTIAVHALVYLNHNRATLSSELMAANVCTNPARIRKVMAKLKKAGLIGTKEGVDGGYCFEGDPETISLRDICEALDITVVSTSWKSGNPEMKCLIASGMANIIDGICAELDAACKEKLGKITIAHIERQIFGNADYGKNRKYTEDVESCLMKITPGS